MSDHARVVAATLGLTGARQRWNEVVDKMPVAPELTSAQVSDRLRQYDFVDGLPVDVVLDDMADLMERGDLHFTHPRHFGLFHTNVDSPGIIADALVAFYDPQLGVSWMCTAASRIEDAALEFFASRLGLDLGKGVATFTSGGSEANLSGILAALVHSFPGFGSGGVAAAGGQPVFYASEHGHHSLLKMARCTGLGESALRWISSDSQQRIDLDALADAVREDRARGARPFLVVGTAGSSGIGSIDPLPELAGFCREQDLWFHVDAAWGGIGLLSEELSIHLDGIEQADSVTWDAHKTLPVPTSAGMFFCKERAVTEKAFSVTAGYVPAADEPQVRESYQQSFQFGRRFTGLKVFATLACYGGPGLEKMANHQAELADRLRSGLERSGWRITNSSPLPLVCFVRDDIPEDRLSDIAARVIAEGTAWISVVHLPAGDRWLRACITNAETRDTDVDMLVEAIERACSHLGFGR